MAAETLRSYLKLCTLYGMAAETLRSYLRACREEASRRLVERVYDANGVANKHWLSYGHNKFLERTMA